jgi:hypothetical protein
VLRPKIGWNKISNERVHDVELRLTPTESSNSCLCHVTISISKLKVWYDHHGHGSCLSCFGHEAMRRELLNMWSPLISTDGDRAEYLWRRVELKRRTYGAYVPERVHCRTQDRVDASQPSENSYLSLYLSREDDDPSLRSTMLMVYSTYNAKTSSCLPSDTIAVIQLIKSLKELLWW